MMWNATTSEVTRSTTASGNIAKTFVIDHPTKSDNYLVHACLEGPEAGVYYRGKDAILSNECTIQLPEYVFAIATEFTVLVTPIYENNFVQLACSEVNNNQFTVYSSGPTKFYWHVYGKRQTIDIEPSKDDVVVKGDLNGPYKWI